MLRFFAGAVVKASRDAIVAGATAGAIMYIDDKICEFTNTGKFQNHREKQNSNDNSNNAGQNFKGHK